MTTETKHQEAQIERLSVVCAGSDGPGHRHIVHSHQGVVVAFLCGRWRPEANVIRVEDRRRHMNVCLPCYKAWEHNH